jgi:plastocyanin
MTPGRKRSMCLALGVVAVLAAPTAVQAAEKSVDMGLPRASQKTFQKTGSDVNDFFPHRVTIHVGDTVRFVPTGFHTVDLPGSRTRRLPIFVSVPPKIAGSADAAGAPFWFNGQNAPSFNPPLFQQSGFGKRRAYTGAKAVLSGLPIADKPKPMTVRFARAGSFRYFCDLHYGMTGVVQVVRADRPVPSAAADRAAVKAQVAATLKVATPLARTTKPPANTIDDGVGGKGGVSVLGFIPDKLTVPVGTTVNVRMASRTDFHTATIGPGDPEKEPNSYLGKLAGSFNGPKPDPAAVLPSDPPGAPAALTPTSHGNGFWSSGVLDADPNTAFPASSSVQ